MDGVTRRHGSGTYCAVRGCNNSWRLLNVWSEGECFDHRPSTRRQCGCAPPYALYEKPKTDVESRKWLAALKLKNPPKRLFVCSYHFIDKKPTEENPFPELWLGYERPPQQKRRKLDRNTSDTQSDGKYILIFFWLAKVCSISSTVDICVSVLCWWGIYIYS